MMCAGWWARGEAVTQTCVSDSRAGPPSLRGAHSIAFQAEGRGGGPPDQQPHARPTLPCLEGSAPPGPRHVRLLPSVSHLGDRPRRPRGSAAAFDQVGSDGHDPGGAGARLCHSCFAPSPGQLGGLWPGWG